MSNEEKTLNDRQVMKPKDLLTSKEAADFLKYSERTLRGSRMTGKLAGRRRPDFIRRGRQILYSAATLLCWQSQFEES